MKKKVLIGIIFGLIVMLILILSFGGNSNVNNDTSTKPTENEESKPNHPYIGNYEQEPVYQKLMQIETCTNPDVLCQMLAELYGEEFTYIKLEQKNLENYEGYKAPYDNFFCSSLALYRAEAPLAKGLIKTDTYVFFRSYGEEPSFVMDADGTYITYSYKISNLESGIAHSVNSWVISDLFMCLHGYIEGSAEKKELIRDSVRYMDYYLELENLIIDSLGENSGSISKTPSLN